MEEDAEASNENLPDILEELELLDATEDAQEAHGIPPTVEYPFRLLKRSAEARAELFAMIEERSSLKGPFKCVVYQPTLRSWITTTGMVEFEGKAWFWARGKNGNRLYGNTKDLVSLRLDVVLLSDLDKKLSFQNRIIINDRFNRFSRREWWKEARMAEMRMVNHGD